MKTNFGHLLILTIILALGGVAFFSIRSNQGLQLVIGTLTVMAYVAWGMIHHYLRGDLHPRVVIEYILIGAVALLLLLIVLIS